MSFVEVIGYVAFLTNVFGALLLARMNAWGWVARLVANVLWVAYAVQIEGGGPMWVNHLAFFGVNMYGFREWRDRDAG